MAFNVCPVDPRGEDELPHCSSNRANCAHVLNERRYGLGSSICRRLRNCSSTATFRVGLEEAIGIEAAPSQVQAPRTPKKVSQIHMTGIINLAR